MKRLFAVGLLAALGLGPATAADPEPVTISLVTYGPGPLAWERFGHNALWVQDPANRIDRIYGWGYFDFNQENFYLRFIRGRMLYAMAGLDARRELDGYVALDRTILVQELNLTDEQAAKMRDFLIWNALPENRFYRYDYYLDNCSTRVRDAIDVATGGALRRATENEPAEHDFRFHTRRLTHPDPLLYTGLQAGLANPIDREISAWEEMFLPIKVHEQVRRVTITGPDGNDIPLVRSERTLNEGPVDERLASPPGWIPAYAAIGLLLAAAIAVPGRHAHRGGLPRLLFTLSAGFWSLLAGLAGVVLAGFWLATDHAVAYWNENLFQLSPLALPLAVLAPMAASKTSPRPVVRLLALAVASFSLIGFSVQLLPGFDQTNGEIIALALPPNLALAWALLRPRS